MAPGLGESYNYHYHYGGPATISWPAPCRPTRLRRGAPPPAAHQHPSGLPRLHPPCYETCSLVGTPSRPTPYCKAAATTPPGPSHRGVTFPPEQLDTAIQNAGRSSTPQPKTPLPGRDPPSVEPAFPLSKTRGRYGCCNTLPIVSGQPTSPLPLSGYQTEHITISRAPTALLGTSSNASLRNPAQRRRVQRL